MNFGTGLITQAVRERAEVHGREATLHKFFTSFMDSSTILAHVHNHTTKQMLERAHPGEASQLSMESS